MCKVLPQATTASVSGKSDPDQSLRGPMKNAVVLCNGLDVLLRYDKVMNQQWDDDLGSNTSPSKSWVQVARVFLLLPARPFC